MLHGAPSLLFGSLFDNFSANKTNMGTVIFTLVSLTDFINLLYPMAAYSNCVFNLKCQISISLVGLSCHAVHMAILVLLHIVAKQFKFMCIKNNVSNFQFLWKNV